ncbi:hypothetical protein B0J12DRAFT_356942 [Macrophomina phaseolina]|uniref:Secreted protein n=1 Tax=Macrophomina phaseolina TaxID=35725 RepID=A0ABQ8FVB8_9PEZI|nr:hypothetical protein B0J12DRAFT_356942 [Macrophomina phaseolina]
MAARVGWSVESALCVAASARALVALPAAPRGSIAQRPPVTTRARRHRYASAEDNMGSAPWHSAVRSLACASPRSGPSLAGGSCCSQEQATSHAINCSNRPSAAHWPCPPPVQHSPPARSVPGQGLASMTTVVVERQADVCQTLTTTWKTAALDRGARLPDGAVWPAARPSAFSPVLWPACTSSTPPSPAPLQNLCASTWLAEESTARSSTTRGFQGPARAPPTRPIPGPNGHFPDGPALAFRFWRSRTPSGLPSSDVWAVPSPDTCSSKPTSTDFH